MPLYDSEMLISIRGFRAYCDICNQGFGKPLEGLNELLVRRGTTDGRACYSGEPFESVPKVTREMVLNEMLAAGWKIETIHGREFIICKGCSAK